jgi:hypothetical protein
MTGVYLVYPSLFRQNGVDRAGQCRSDVLYFYLGVLGLHIIRGTY